uniref:Exostosin GT47 domain-containing protein n=1 Tax=Eutreptiella gymnastica TaxID=73025 RepID=A0A7S1N890_9EUGL|mmetsp:Transcript_135351/g.234742  ORF Transcript_135351/g.234742 Transcript_135351/m.234742 type:complete len:550 (+) Transcript_135351:39-1688(+)
MLRVGDGIVFVLLIVVGVLFGALRYSVSSNTLSSEPFVVRPHHRRGKRERAKTPSRVETKQFRHGWNLPPLPPRGGPEDPPGVADGTGRGQPPEKPVGTAETAVVARLAVTPAPSVASVQPPRDRGRLGVLPVAPRDPSVYFWTHSPQDPKDADLRSPPAEGSDLLHRFATEPGIRRLRMVFEHTFMPGMFDKQGLRKPGAGGSCKLLEELEYSVPKDEALCLPATALLYPKARSSLEEFMNPREVGYEKAYEGMLSWGTLLGSQQYPFFSGASMRYVADAVYETETHFFYLRHSKRWHPVRRVCDLKSIPNRSLVYWNLNPHLDDINVLRTAITNGTLDRHIFLVAHNQDRIGFPAWLLECPFILKVFSAHVNANQTHPKMVPLPEGIHPTKSCFLLAQARRRAGLTPRARFLFAKFQLSCESRVQLLNTLNESDVVEQDEMLRRVNKTNYYTNLIEHKYILAPPGNGIDTFRLWESLYLGRVPIAQRILHPSLLEDLPVVLLDDWAQLRRKDLAVQWEMLGRRHFDLNKLWGPWWILRIVREVLDTP